MVWHAIKYRCVYCCSCGTGEIRACECWCRCTAKQKAERELERKDPLAPLPQKTWPELRGFPSMPRHRNYGHGNHR